ncbi:hypothetical protein CAPTEDRAFT_97992 [Capitella teleta]|uniref:Uncharacterized protein n=1 Tax=Capitella teleta TaxID=283909 RepID=R7TUY6_CAPTE|nr:hypothetical protein CAPTEDRAFT_97992 [Capitella teleta]|eukprot:ELT95286.1 hypothetical protein CAPTEDRAFT_97992 [Capitella teleta]
MIFSFFSSFPFAAGLFTNSTDGLAEKFYLEKYKLDVTPAEWTFYQAALIYFWQSLWLTYGVFSICRRTGDSFLYTMFPVMPPILYVVFSFSLACNVSWLLIWDKEYMEVALVFVNLMSCTLYICLVVSLRRLNEFGELLYSYDLMREVWINRILVQNGLAMFAVWGTVAAMFNFAIVLTYRTGADQGVASTVSLSIFIIEIMVWWIFDNFVFEKYFRYLFTPYFVLLVSIAGIIAKNWDPEKMNAIFTLLVFATVAVLTIVKITLSCWRHKHRPLYVNSAQHYDRPCSTFEVRGLLHEQRS